MSELTMFKEIITKSLAELKIREMNFKCGTNINIYSHQQHCGNTEGKNTYKRRKPEKTYFRENIIFKGITSTLQQMDEQQSVSFI